MELVDWVVDESEVVLLLVVVGVDEEVVEGEVEGGVLVGVVVGVDDVVGGVVAGVEEVPVTVGVEDGELGII